MKQSATSLIYTSARAIGLAVTPAMAANSHYAAGDLVLFLQQEGSTNTVYVDLGNAATVFRGAAAGPGAANLINFVDISATLASAFGADWASNPLKIEKLYAGLAGVYSSNNTSSALVNGDPYRTVYVSAARSSVGTVGAADSNAWAGMGNTSMTDAASDIQAMNNVFANNYDAVSVVSPTSVSLIEDKNLFLSPGIQGPGFTTFDGGVQQAGSVAGFGSFGAAGGVKFALDLYRILAKTGISGQVAGDLRSGTYEGTVTVNSSGQVSFISQGAASSSAYDTWIGTYPTITAPADQLAEADPDGDGVSNLAEFGFGGDPGNPGDNGIRLMQTVDANSDALKDLTLTLEVRSGATFSASGSDLVSAPVDEMTYTIQGSTDLVDWNSTVSEVTPALGSGSPKAGYEFKTFRLNAGNGLSGKGFLRAAVTN